MKLFNFKYVTIVLCSIVLTFLNLESLLAEKDSSSTSDEEKYIINEDNLELSDLEKDFIIAINKYRDSEGKKPLKINSKLMNEARKQSSLMVYYGQKNYLYRTEFSKTKESVYYGPKTIEAVIDGLKKSTTNNETLLSDTMTHLGVGVVNSTNNYRGSWTIRYVEIQEDKTVSSTDDDKSSQKSKKTKKTQTKNKTKKKKSTKQQTSVVENTTSNKEEIKTEETTSNNNENDNKEIIVSTEEKNTTNNEIVVSTEDTTSNTPKVEEEPKEPTEEDIYVIISPEEEDLELTESEKSMIIAVNKHRARYNRPILKVSKLLMSGARQQSRLMLPYIGTNPYRLHWMAPRSGAQGENIFPGPRTVLHAMSGFIQSSGHNNNMLSPYYTHIGVGAAFTSGGRGCWTQRFARFRG